MFTYESHRLMTKIRSYHGIIAFNNVYNMLYKVLFCFIFLLLLFFRLNFEKETCMASY